MERMGIVSGKKDDKKDINIVPYTNDIKINCKLCNSEHREEAEKEYERSGNYKGVYNLLKKKEMAITYPSVRNHLVFHYGGRENRELLEEYANDVNQWLDLQGNPEEGIRRRIAILERRLILLDASSESLTLTERRKNIELVKKLCDTILSHETKLEEYTQELEPFRQVIETFTSIVNAEAKSIEDKALKQQLVKILNKIIIDLRNEFKDMM